MPVSLKDWERVLDTTKAAGLNCVATYVFWNLHERKRDCYDFSDGKDLSRFLALCKAERSSRDLASRTLLLRGMELRRLPFLASGRARSCYAHLEHPIPSTH